MSASMVVLRVIHIGLGVFWAGTIFFVVGFVQPVLRASGPEAGRFMMRLRERRFFEIVPAAALLTILSGVIMLWQLSGGFQLDWLTIPTGISLSVGGIAAIIAFVIGMTGMRRSTLRLLDLASTLGPDGPTPEQQQTMNGLRRTGLLSARWVAVLLAIAVTAMAVARYLY